jgi:hypothetical protein
MDAYNMQDKQKKHEFHFVIRRSMRERLKKLTVFEKPLCFSAIIKKILKVLRPAIKVEHKWGVQRMSKYRYVSPDPDEERDHIHVYIDKDVYRELKLIHQDLNFYSIGQIMRMFLDLFLELVEEYGKNVFKYLKRTYKEWRDIAKNFRLTLREEVRQLNKILPMIEGGNGHLSIYDSTFTPFWIRRL